MSGDRKHPYRFDPKTAAAPRRNIQTHRYIAFLTVMFIVVTILVAGAAQVRADVPMGETCSQTTVFTTTGNWEQLYNETAADRAVVIAQNNRLNDEIGSLKADLSRKDVVIMNQKSRIMILQQKIKELRR